MSVKRAQALFHIHHAKFDETFGSITDCMGQSNFISGRILVPDRCVDKWINPEGIGYYSPGLRGTSYPGYDAGSELSTTLKGLNKSPQVWSYSLQCIIPNLSAVVAVALIIFQSTPIFRTLSSYWLHEKTFSLLSDFIIDFHLFNPFRVDE
jgi:hypothetical protein